MNTYTVKRAAAILAAAACLFTGLASAYAEEETPTPDPEGQVNEQDITTSELDSENPQTTVPTVDPNAAADVTGSLSGGKGLTDVYFERLADYDVTTRVRVDKGHDLQLTWTDAVTVQGFWLQWEAHPERYLVEQLAADSESVLTAYTVMENYDNRYLPVGNDCRGIRITAEDTVVYSSLRAYGPGTLPSYIRDWAPPAEDADILIVVAHPDDEHIFMGGLVPYYVVEKGLAASVMLMTCSDRYREDEALEGLWAVGLRTSPIFAGFRDLRTNSRDRILKAWVEKKASGAIVEEIRRCRPEVVVTHDIWGEYGHGAHRACSYLVKRAIELAADPEKFPESAETYGAWQVQKLYFHAWRDEQGFLSCTTLPWDEPLAAFDGKTAREMAAVGYSYHASQSDNWTDIMAGARFDNAIYSLVLSEVGADEACNDLFEHIDPGMLTNAQ